MIVTSDEAKPTRCFCILLSCEIGSQFFSPVRETSVCLSNSMHDPARVSSRHV